MSPFESLTLPNGTSVPNRIAKAAMEENMADAGHLPSAELLRLYQAWADGGAGLIITGNVMIDRRAMTGPGVVVLEDGTPLEAFRNWARIGRARGAQIWLQLSHPGRQMMKNMGQQTWAPSAVALDLGKHSSLFAMPKAMTEHDIDEVIARFVAAAKLAEQAGFSGVQIHAAHGYLISQFLSPLSNRRTDRWGGSLQNRARLLIETVKAVRAAVSPGFSIAVKLNSADFQRGGFDAADAKTVVEMLNELPVDLVELSAAATRRQRCKAMRATAARWRARPISWTSRARSQKSPGCRSWSPAAFAASASCNRCSTAASPLRVSQPRLRSGRTW
ncbi:2,4-dienoyl-CoA reductase-like NADH-dependent reductase (Old Yellow Enzyme family) [Bradyrhizobium sp. USDA 3240]